MQLDTLLGVRAQLGTFSGDGAAKPTSRILAVFIVLLFLIGCVPLALLLPLSSLLNRLWPKPLNERDGRATTLVIVCLFAEVFWFGGLAWGLARAMRLV